MMDPETRGVETMLFNRLYEATMGKTWGSVVEILKESEVHHAAKLTKSSETALHIAISNYHPNKAKAASASSHDRRLREMIEAMKKGGTLTGVLKAKNERGDTPLHLAAAVGWLPIFDYNIAIEENGDPDRLLHERNNKGETPVFVAALHGHIDIFRLLHKRFERKESLARRKDGNTILHKAIFEENFELAHLIIHDDYYPNLVNFINEEGESPLHVLAKKQNVFKSSSHLRLYDSIIYYCVFVDKMKLHKRHDSAAALETELKKFPGNYSTCVKFFVMIRDAIVANFKKPPPTCGTDVENHFHQQPPTQTKEANGQTSYHDLFPPNYVTCMDLFKFAMKVILVIVGVGFWRVQKIKEKKTRYLNAMEVLDKMLEKESSYKHEIGVYDNNGGQQPQMDPRNASKTPKIFSNAPPDFDVVNDVDDDTCSAPPPQPKEKADKAEAEAQGFSKNDSAIVVAAKMGILEIVKKIYRKCPVAIQDVDSQGKNVVMLAAQYRHTAVFDYLCDADDADLPEYMFHHFDKGENSILHLAAKLDDNDLYPWRIPGAALQMQWEIKWYKHVKASVSTQSISHPNKEGKTPRNIFSVSHKKLKQAGIDWLIKTSESCSVVAALIAAVAFATSSTVPGGLNQDEGKPVLQHEQAFDVFAVASLVALCLSVTALVFFLAIITSRCEERDFKRNLPSKLLAGLSSLFASIAAILMSFCSGHIFILRKELRFAVIPIYASITIPVAFFAIAQLPLYFDLLWAAYKKVPLRSYKAFSY